MHRILVLILALLAVISPIYAASFSVETTVDKDKVEFGESLQLVVTLTQEYGSGRMQNLSIPQISNIPGFDIASTRSGQSTTIVNGVGQFKSQVVYELVPQKPGEFTIPAFNFKNQNGEESSSNPIKITVMPPPANNSSKNDANNSSDESNFEQSEPKAATSIFKALLMMGFILLLFIAIPFIYLSQRAKKIAKNTKWEEDAVVLEAKNSEVKSAPIKVVKPIRKTAKAAETPKTAYTTKKSSDYNLGDYKKMNLDNPELQKRIELAGETVEKIRKEVKKVLVGQDELLDFLILALVSDGHILLEGVPGLAKTLAIKALARTVKTNFSRIQFTPDLLPADLIGTRIFNQKTNEFQTHKGPVFSNFVLADEINRAPAKVQSALLESMEERQVTIEHETFKLTEPFLVLATQNPIETEGTYTLSEAQVDRFLFKVVVEYPSFDEERIIVKRMGLAEKSHQVGIVEPVLDVKDIIALRSLTQEIYVDDKVVDYILRVVDATRSPRDYGLDLSNYIRFGASPRASIYLTRAARSHALIKGRAYVLPDDVKAVMKEVLRHRVIPTYEAEADEIDSDAIVETIKQGVPV